jgi:hypothetical protein
MTVVALRGGSAAASPISAATLPGAGRPQLARASQLSLSRAPAGLRAAVRTTLGTSNGPLSSASPPTTLTEPGTASFGTSVAISGSTAVVGALGLNGAAYVFVRSGSTWKKQAKLTEPHGNSGPPDFFGWSVAISGSTVVVGAPAKNSRTGVAYVFARSGTTWKEQTKLTEPHAAKGDFFGGDVAIYKSTVVVDAPFTNSDRGAVYVFARSGTTWKRQATITEPHATKHDVFGDGAVAIYGSTAMIGAEGKGSRMGAAYVFVRSGTTWKQQATLPDPHAAKNDGFGASAALYKSEAVIGAQGAAYVFVRSGTSWTQQTEFIDPHPGDAFGAPVAIYGSRAVVGANQTNSGAGAAYVFTHSGTTWTKQATLTDPGGGKTDFFGLSVALSGSTAVVGAPGENHHGAAYIFAGL